MATEDYINHSTEMEKESKENKNPNCFVVINTTNNDQLALEASGDRIIVQEDKFKTGYECKTCDGDGFINKDCPMCVGHYLEPGIVGRGPNNEIVPCRQCAIGRGTLELVGGIGKKTCPDCKGRGGLIVATQQSERRPTTGVIKSIGPEVSRCKNCFGAGVVLIQGVIVGEKTPVGTIPKPITTGCFTCNGKGKTGLQLKVGDRIIYPIFAGHAINFKQKGTCRIMHENEVMGKIYGLSNIGELMR